MQVGSWVALVLGLASVPCVFYWASSNVKAMQSSSVNTRLGSPKTFGVVEALTEASESFGANSRRLSEAAHGGPHLGDCLTSDIGCHHEDAYGHVFSGCQAETNDHWNYEHPDCWEHTHETCGGAHQSPVNIDDHHVLASSNFVPLSSVIKYKSLTGLTVKNHGHGLQVDGDFGELEYHGHMYDAKQFHIHFPSEHAVNGMLAAGEMNIVHQKRGASGTNDLIVIGVLFDIGVESELLNRLGLEGSAPSKGTSQAVGGGALALGTELEEELKGGYYRYDGSLTTPPCSETVKWFVLEKRKTVTLSQVHFFKALYPDPANNRPLQTLNNRAIGKNSLDIDSCGAGHGGHDEEGHDDHHWDYLYPQCWPKKYPECDGTKQSPINIMPGDVTSVGPSRIAVSYVIPAQKTDVMNDGHGLQVNGGFGVFMLNGMTYYVKQIKVHFPSEHSVDGKLAAGELHIVHQLAGSTGNDDLLMVAVLIDIGGSSGLLTKLGLPGSAPAPGQTRATEGDIDLRAEIGGAILGNFYRYDGSLTTPPCSETVKWFVLETRITASANQVDAFNQVFPSPQNNRPLQLLHGRSVVKNNMEPDGFGPDASCSGNAQSWTYMHPQCWAGEYNSCDGMEQSPINIESTKVSAHSDGDKLADMVVYASASGLNVQNNGHVLKVSGELGDLVAHGATYKATSFSVHFPSEHAIDGKLHAAELQIEHKLEGDAKGTVMLAVLFDIGEESSLMKSLGLPDAIPAKGQQRTTTNPIDLSDSLSTALKGSFWRYDGSLTKPPCTESIKWMIAQTTMKVSSAQIQSFKSAFPNPANNRPIQLLNGRTVMENKFEMGGCDVSHSAGHSEGHVDYLYPQCWAHHEPQCAGKHQSPVNINSATLTSEGMEMLHGVLKYEVLSSYAVSNSGHGVQVTAPFGKFLLDDASYDAIEIKVHFPSEHAIDGKLHAGELHIVHQLEGATGTDDLVVLSVFFDVGAESSLLKQLGLPVFEDGEPPISAGGSKVVEAKLDLGAELKASLEGSYFRYDGSLTIPPCSETVKYFVLETPVTATRQQIQAFKGLFPNPANNRPLQLLNGRHVVENKHSVPGKLENIHANFRDSDENTTNKPMGDWAVIIGMLGTAGLFLALILATWSVRDKKARSLTPALVAAGGLRGASYAAQE